MNTKKSKFLGIPLLFLSAIFSLQAQIDVTGTVSDAGSPLPGVNVVVKGTSSGVQTDFDGNYALSNVDENATLVFSYVGYVTQEIAVGGRNVINVELVEDLQSLDEVIVLGYGQSQNKKKVSTAVATLSADRIAEIPVSRAEAALQGTVPGTVITQTSGSPGAPLTVRLRGVSTINNSNPIYIVDGMQMPDIQHLSPSDIQSFTTLKDAAAAAIYGARGGNGVILVETKKGNRNSGLRVDIDGFVGFQSLANKPENIMNRDQYVRYYNEFANASNGAFNPISDADRNLLEDTDWYDAVFDSGVLMTNTHLAVSNGEEKYSYYIGGAINDVDGLVGGKDGKSNYNRKNIKANFEADLLPNLNIRAEATIADEVRNQLAENNAGTGNAILNYLPALPAIYPTFDTTNNVPYDMGQFGTGIVNGVTLPFSGVGAITNPFVALTNNDDETQSDVKTFNIGATWEPIENLKISSSFSSYRDISQRRTFIKSYDYRDVGHNFFNLLGQYSETDFDNKWTQWDGTASYDFTQLGEGHSLNAIVGFSVYDQFSSVTGLSGAGFSVNDFDDANFALINDPSSITNFTPFEANTGLLSYFARLTYDYNEKYLFSASIRRDESSNFGPENREGYFPSFSAGWVMSEEDFLADVDFINLLKVRASWGINGIDNVPSDQFRNILIGNVGPIFNESNTPGFASNFLPNRGIKWEEVNQTNIGVDINAFNNSLGVTFDYYIKKTSDMLLQGNLPLYTGSQAPFDNIGDVENKGFEALISYRKSYDNGFSWNAGFNFAVNDNEITNLNGRAIPGGNIGFIFNGPITLSAEGNSIASFYGLKVQDIDANGAFIFEDLNGDNVINADDRTFIGNPFPDFTYGFNFGASYKGFDLGGRFYGSQGNDIYDATTRLDAPFANRPTSYLNDGAPANLLSGATGSDQTLVSDFYVKDGSFLKLKELTLGYSLPQSVTEKLSLSKARFYVTGQNLFVITDYEGVDPEIGEAFSGTFLDIGIDRGFNPQPRAYLFGFQVQF